MTTYFSLAEACAERQKLWGGADKIDLSGFGLSGFDDIQGGIKRGFFGTEIDLGGGDELFLTGLFGVKVDAGDFIF